MTKLTDTQGILQSSASQRIDGSILPLPTTLSGSGGTTKAVNALRTRGYAEERETSDPGAIHRTDGATLPELIEATGWLPHTTRAALTGIRKKGRDVQRSKRGDVTCYRIIR